MNKLRIGNVTVGGREPAFILGPCVIESEKFVRRMAQKIAKICAAENVSFIFKASYDKANRTSVKSFRGIDARAGCQILASIGRELKIPVTTDVHSPTEAEIAGEFIDLLQIPAFLCFFFSCRRRHTRSYGDWSSDVCSSDLQEPEVVDKPEGRALPRVDGHVRFEGVRFRSEERRVGKECRSRSSPYE